MRSNRVAIGTAAFGLPYGATRPLLRLEKKECYRILEKAGQLGIKIIDTSPYYGCAQNIIGEYGANKFQIYTKINGSDLLKKNGEAIILKSISDLKINSVYGCFLQGIEKWGRQDLEKVINKLKNQNIKSFIQKIGISCYSPKLALAISKQFGLSLMQVPFNILDRRASSCGLFQWAADNGVEVLVRSIFMQGLLLSDPDKRRKGNFPEKATGKVKVQLERKRVSALDFCASFVFNTAKNTFLVFGVTSHQELQSIKQINPIKYRHIQIPAIRWNDKFDPRNWRQPA